MKSSKNPFYQWLGIQSRRPHYYQLLGVPRTADRKQIKLAAQARLGQLQAADPGEDTAGLKQVEAALEKALRVLSDPKRRKEYDQKLEAAEQKRAGQKAGPAADRESASSGAGPTYSQDDLLPPNSLKSDGPREPDTPRSGKEAPSEEVAGTPVAQPVENKPDGPIPLAVPLQAPSASVSEVLVAQQTENESVGGTSWRDSDGYDPISGLKKKSPLSGKFRVRSRGGRRGKRSIMVPLVSMFFFVVGIAGLLYFLFAYLEMNGGAPMTADGSNVTAGDGQGDPDSTDQADGLGDEDGTGKQPIVPPADDGGDDGRSGMDPDQMEDPQTVDFGRDDPKTDDPDKDDPDNDEPDNDEPDKDEPDNDEPDNDEPDNDEPDKPKMDRAESRPLTFAEKAKFRRLIQRADRNLYQRNLELASETARQAAALLEGEPEAGPLDKEGQELVELTASVLKMSENLQGFWQQVITSGRENDGDIPVDDSGERFVTVVEAGQDYIIFRSAGTNLRYRYREMPAGLAMDLADSGEKEDVPTWNIQKATFYAVNRRVDLKYGDRAMAFIREAEQDGRDLGYLRDYLRSDFNTIGLPTAPLPAREPSRLQSEVRELKKSLEIPSRIGSLSVEECASFSRAAAAEMDKLEEDQNLPRAALCEIIRQLAIQAGDVDLALESVSEQRCWLKFDTIDLTAETLNDLADRDLDRESARLCIDSYLRFRQSSQNDVAGGSKIRKLHQRMEALAKEAGFDDLSRQLGQLQRP